MKIRLSAWMAVLLTTLAAVGCHMTGHNLPPAQRLAQPGPGVGGPGPAVMAPPRAPVTAMTAAPALAGAPALGMGVAQASAMQVIPGFPGCFEGGAVPMPGVPQSVQIMFSRPESMQVYWDDSGSGNYDALGLTTPGRQSFQQGGIYRLKIANIDIAGYEAVELYPTLEVGPPSARTAAYLAHSAIPVQFTPEDLNQALSGNFVTKVIYLPDPEFQALAVAGVKTLVSTRLSPGQDPITEAENKGAILAVIRLGNKDMETPTAISATPSVMPANYNMGIGNYGASGGVAGAYYDGSCGPDCLPVGMPVMAPGGMPMALMGQAQYGMTMSGTPIGLPGPPHIPLGVPAGLQKHVIKNWTKHHIPKPTSKVKLNVQQRPGVHYPKPANSAWITEELIHPSVRSSHQTVPLPTGQIHHVCPPGCPTCN